LKKKTYVEITQIRKYPIVKVQGHHVPADRGFLGFSPPFCNGKAKLPLRKEYFTHTVIKAIYFNKILTIGYIVFSGRGGLEGKTHFLKKMGFSLQEKHHIFGNSK